MGLTATASGGDFKMVPPGMHVARCYRVIDLGTQENQKFGKWQHKCMINFEVYGDADCQTDDGKPLSISLWHTVSLNEKANLRKDLESWRGRPFTKEELDGFQVDKLLGAPAMINVIHNDAGDKTYANIASISPVPKGMEIPNPTNDNVVWNMDDPDWDVYEALPDGLKKVINASIEWPRISGGGDNKDTMTDGQRAYYDPVGEGNREAQQATAASLEDEDLPF